MWALEPPKHLLLSRLEKERTLAPLLPHTLTIVPNPEGCLFHLCP